MLLITQSQGLGSNFDVDFWAGVIRFSQNRFWGGTAGGGGRGPPDARHELVGRGRGPEPGLGRGGSRSGLIAWPWASPHPFGGLGFPLFKAQLDGAYTGRIKRESLENLASGQTVHSFLRQLRTSPGSRLRSVLVCGSSPDPVQAFLIALGCVATPDLSHGTEDMWEQGSPSRGLSSESGVSRHFSLSQSRD